MVRLADSTQLRFSFGTYLEARAFGKDSSFSDWALTCVYLGRSIGTILGGALVRRYRRFKSFLQLNIVVDLLIYMFFALGWIREYLRAHFIRWAGSNYLIDPEQPAFAPFLAFIGATEGFAESLWLVALLSLVDAEGGNNTNNFGLAHSQSTQISLCSMPSLTSQWHLLEI